VKTIMNARDVTSVIVTSLDARASNAAVSL
jgi:hypothetical protein